MDRVDLIIAVYPYIKDPAINVYNLSTEQLRKIYNDIYGKNLDKE
jgi:hypothetical protein